MFTKKRKEEAMVRKLKKGMNAKRKQDKEGKRRRGKKRNETR